MYSIASKRGYKAAAARLPSINATTELLAPSSAAMEPRRSITDIEYYRGTDASHMHAMEAQSTMRKFQLKVRNLEAAKERKEQWKLKQNSVETAQSREEDDKPVRVSNYIERTPTTILRALASQIGRDETGADYKYHDDPFLYPYNSNDKMAFVRSKEGGKRTARYIVSKHRDLFEQNLIYAEPPIKAFAPPFLHADPENPGEIDGEKVSVETLDYLIESCQVLDAIKVHKILVEKGEEEIETETTLKLLEMAAFTGQDDVIPEDTADLKTQFKSSDWNPWVDEAFESIKGSLTDEQIARIEKAMILGAYRQRFGKKVKEIYLGAKSPAFVYDIDYYNAVYNAVFFAKEMPYFHKKLKDWLQIVKHKSLVPNHESLKNILRVLTILVKDRPEDLNEALRFAYSLIAGFKAIGVEPCAGTYVFLTAIALNDESGDEIVLPYVLEQIEGKDLIAMVKNANDNVLLGNLMKLAYAKGDLERAHTIHEMTLSGDNSLLIGDEIIYYSNYMALQAEKENLQTVFKFLNRHTPLYCHPRITAYITLLNRVRLERKFEFLPKIWSDIVISGLTKPKNKEDDSKALIMMKTIVNTVGEAEALLNGTDDPSWPKLSYEIIPIVKGILTFVQGEGLEKLASFPLYVEILNDILDTSLTLESTPGFISETAFEAFDFARLNAGSLSGQLSDATLSKFLRFIFEEEGRVEKNKARALNILLYAAEVRSSRASKFAVDISKAFPLSREEKKAVDQLFANDAEWVRLARG